MRLIFAAAVAVGMLAAPSFIATASADTMKNCAASWKAMSKADQAKTTYKDYSSACLKGGAAPAAMPVKATTAAAAPMATPAKAATAAPTAAASTVAMKSGATPAGATGQCKDGSYTMSKTHSGACSKHGGVAKWL
jgi:hypothetical protein